MSRRRRRKDQQVEEKWNQRVRLDGKGEDPVIQAMLSDKIVKGSNLEAADVALAFQSWLKGDDSYLNDPKQRDKVARIRQAMARMDEDERKWNEDKEKFIEEVFDRADKIKQTGERAERTKAEGALMYQNAVVNAKADRSTKLLRLKHLEEHGPQEEIHCAGKWETINGKPKLQPEIIRIMNRIYVLRPGMNKVPSFVADRYRQIMRSREETAARKSLLDLSDGQSLEGATLNARWNKLGQDFGSPAQSMPINANR